MKNNYNQEEVKKEEEPPIINQPFLKPSPLLGLDRSRPKSAAAAGLLNVFSKDLKASMAHLAKEEPEAEIPLVLSKKAKKCKEDHALKKFTSLKMRL